MFRSRPAAEAVVVRCPFGRHPELRGLWVPAFAGKTRGKKAGAQEPRWCRCHGTDLSAVGFPPARCSGSFPIRFPRESGGLGAAVVPLPWNGPHRSELSAGTMLRLSFPTRRSSAVEAVVVRCPFGRHPELRGPWVPAFAGKTRGQEGERPTTAGVAAPRSRPSAPGGPRRGGARVPARHASPATRGDQAHRCCPAGWRAL